MNIVSSPLPLRGVMLPPPASDMSNASLPLPLRVTLVPPAPGLPALLGSTWGGGRQAPRRLHNPWVLAADISHLTPPPQITNSWQHTADVSRRLRNQWAAGCRQPTYLATSTTQDLLATNIWHLTMSIQYTTNSPLAAEIWHLMLPLNELLAVPGSRRLISVEASTNHGYKDTHTSHLGLNALYLSNISLMIHDRKPGGLGST